MEVNRLQVCMWSDDTGLFTKNLFQLAMNESQQVTGMWGDDTGLFTTQPVSTSNEWKSTGYRYVRLWYRSVYKRTFFQLGLNGRQQITGMWGGDTGLDCLQDNVFQLAMNGSQQATGMWGDDILDYLQENVSTSNERKSAIYRYVIWWWWSICNRFFFSILAGSRSQQGTGKWDGDTSQLTTEIFHYFPLD